MKPLVSIVTIVYNGEKHLEQTINSVLSQTYPHIEYIIIDGGSKDNTVSIIKKYAARLAYWISEPDKGISDAFNKGLRQAKGEWVGIINADKGISDAFNKGLRQAKGEWVGIINADDWYETDAIRKVIEAAGDNDVVFGNVQYWKNSARSFIQISNLEYLEDDVSIIHPAVFIKKDAYEKFGYFDTSLRCAMDYELLLRMKINYRRFVHVPAVISNMRWEGFSDKQWRLGRQETLAIKNRYFPERKFGNYMHHYRKIWAISIIKVMEKMGLHGLLKFYRERFSKLKKTYD
jgi:glycosyltransferase involved in cell wall biosynthesis